MTCFPSVQFAAVWTSGIPLVPSKSCCRCRIIDGHLHFVLQEQRDNTSVDLLGRYTFPGLREITHHLLMYRVFNLTSLRWLFPNLAVIRGSVLFHNYALVIYDMPGLQDVGLVSLTAILRGSVRIERNPRLCYLHTVDWSSITLNPLVENYVNRNRPDSECPPCTGSLRCLPSTECGPPRCWGPYDCQTLCGECPGGCVKGECCHEECVGGCLTPNNATSCHACRNVLDHDTCVPSCTSPKFKVSEHRCEPREVCSVNYAIKRDTQECVERCPTGYNTTTVFDGSRYITQCDPCKGMVCTKRCSATTVKSISHAQLLRGCTIINDFLTIYINGGENMERELEENLSSVEEITGYLKVFHSNLTSLKFLRNLKTIHGQTLAHGKYSLVIVDNPRLESVWNTTNLTIIRGLVLVQFNPRLCLHHLHTLINNTNITGLSENDVSSTSNGDKVPFTSVSNSFAVLDSVVPTYSPPTVLQSSSHTQASMSSRPRTTPSKSNRSPKELESTLSACPSSAAGPGGFHICYMYAPELTFISPCGPLTSLNLI
nr:insulin receptor-like [Cherax quadricarinatus]